MKRISSIQHDRLKTKKYFLIILLFIFLGRQEGFAAGWVDVNGGMNVSPFPVTVGKNFDVTFSLKEYKGESKSFEYIQLWIQDGSGNDLFDAKTWNNVFFSPWQQQNFSATTFLDPAWGRKPGSYRAIVRGKISGDVPFNFGIVDGSDGVNPRSFSATPIIAQGPMSGSPGTTFTQWGEGFTANSTAILHFKKPDGSEYDPQPLGMDSSGHFETSYTAPTDKEPGQYTWWAVDGPTGVSSNQVTYTIEEPAVNPAVAQSPMSGPPGTTFTQWGTGFTPNSTATLHFKKPDGSEYPTQPQIMDSTGHFDIPYPSPTDKEPGQYTWWAVDGPTGVSSNQVTYTIEEPAVNPAVAQSPMSGPPGTTFTQWGTGFTPNSTATLHFKKPDGSEYPTQPQVMDSTGHFEIPYPSPADKEPGQYTWWAVDGPTGVSSNQVTYTIEEPAVNPAVAQSPMSGPPGTTFTQWGTGFTPNSTATLHFKKPDGSEYPTQPQVMDSTGHFDIPYPSPTDKEPGQYTWWAVDGPTGISSNQVTYTIDAPTYKLKIGIQSSPKQIIQSGEGLVFYIDIVNEGIADAVDIPVTITHADNFGINGISVWGCDPKESENPACKRTDISSTGANFLVSIPAGSSAKLIGTGIVEAAPVAVVVTASEVTETVIRGPKPPADLPGIQKVELCSQNRCVSDENDDLGLDLSKDTIVLTHGLQPAGCEREKLWTAFEATSDNPAPAGYLLNQKYNGDVNVLQFFWEGACHKHTGGNRIPTRDAYEKGRKNVYHAGEQLAYLLLQNLSKEGNVLHSKKIHFVGHSLGTGVTAYAANLFLRQASYITDAQVTILDYPSTERVEKILGPNYGEEHKDWGKEQGFDRNFFASTLPVDIDRSGFSLHVDNYFSSKKKIIDNVRSFGVGMPINGPSFYNYPELEDPGLIKVFLPNEEGTANDHSGVHQWYRWTMEPNEDENFTGTSECSSVEWNNLPLILTDRYTPTVPLYIIPEIPKKIVDECCLLCICKELGEIQQSLSPCSGGWHHSIIDGSTFPGGNGDEADETSSFGIEPSNVTEYGCAAGGIDGSYICREDNQALAPQAAAAEFAEMALAEPEDAPDRFYIELNVNVPKFVRYISFDYTFNNAGDGDYVYLFAEGESIWLMSGNDAEQGKIQFSGQIPLRMTAGANKLIVALYGVGEKNAEFKIENFKFTTVADTDNDGYGDDDDVFPDDPAEWEDTDEDGIGNNADPDDDNDGFQDTDDTFPLDPDENADTDGDGTGDNADPDDGMYPDHAVTASAVDKAQLAPGENFIYSATVKNQGTGRARTTTLRYYRSTDSTIDSNDTPLGTDVVGTLNAGHTSPENINLTAPATPGTYWLGSCVDPVSGDSNLDNNCGTAVQITVASGQPDLLVSSISSPSNADSRELFNITALFKNQGTLDATPVTANIYYMSFATGTTSEAVYQLDVPALDVNETVSGTATVQAPCEAGDYALAVCINPGMNVESNGNNNCLLRSFSVSGDCSQNSFLPAINLLLLNGQE